MKKIMQLLPFFVGLALLMASANMRALGAVNGFVQLVLFTFVVCIPAWRTERMSYVDIGWPWGLVAIGVIALVMGQGDSLRVAMVSGLYIFIGLRMGIFAIKLWRVGALQRELPRYQYQNVRWERTGETNVPLARQVEVLSQGLANASYLSFPAFIIATNPSPSIAIVEFLGFGLAAAAFAFESIADIQKAGFIARAKANGERRSVCNEGLWRYTRHPNYFGEWMVWNGLIVMALPSLVPLFKAEGVILAVLLAAGLGFVSRLMYLALVYGTGAKPSEYYSVQKRPEYANYQQNTNIFFPGPARG